MVKLNHKYLFFILFCTLIHSVYSTTYTNLETDIRYYIYENKRDNYFLDNIRFSVRKNIADKKADRFTLFLLIHENDMFSNIKVKDSFIKYKGPMGRWNITFGRFGIPYGLKYYYSTDALPFSTVEDYTVGMDNDNGIMVSGVTRFIDYALSVTHGYNSGNLYGYPLNGLITGRIGTQFGIASEFTIGLSSLISYSSDKCYYKERISKYLAGIDCIAYISRAILRAEVSGGFENERKIAIGFLGMDYSIHPKFEINFTGSLIYNMHNKKYNDKEYFGVSYQGKHFTIRGGCQYEYYKEKQINIIFQLYKLFSFNR